MVLDGISSSELTGEEQLALRVLVVEDEPLIRLDIVETLQEAGYTVVGQAGTGEEAIELAESCEPDVVVADVGGSEVGGGLAGVRDVGDFPSDADVVKIDAIAVSNCPLEGQLIGVGGVGQKDSVPYP